MGSALFLAMKKKCHRLHNLFILQKSECRVTTRIHSSRMCSARFNGHLYKGGVSAQGWACVCPGCVCPAVCVCPGGCTPSSPCRSPIACWDTLTPVNRMTDRCKNITLPQLRLRVVTSARTQKKSVVLYLLLLLFEHTCAVQVAS